MPFPIRSHRPCSTDPETVGAACPDEANSSCHGERTGSSARPERDRQRVIGNERLSDFKWLG